MAAGLQMQEACQIWILIVCLDLWIAKRSTCEPHKLSMNSTAWIQHQHSNLLEVQKSKRKKHPWTSRLSIKQIIWNSQTKRKSPLRHDNLRSLNRVVSHSIAVFTAWQKILGGHWRTVHMHITRSSLDDELPVTFVSLTWHNADLQPLSLYAYMHALPRTVNHCHADGAPHSELLPKLLHLRARRSPSPKSPDQHKLLLSGKPTKDMQYFLLTMNESFSGVTVSALHNTLKSELLRRSSGIVFRILPTERTKKMEASHIITHFTNTRSSRLWFTLFLLLLDHTT